MADASSTSPSKETVTLRLPSGEMVDAIVPAGFSDVDVKSYVRMKRPDLFGAPTSPASMPGGPSTQPQPTMTTGQKIAALLASRPYNKVGGFQGGPQQDMPGSTEGPGMMRGLAEYSVQGPGSMGQGAADLAQGNIAKGGHELLSGGMNTLTPLTPLVAPGNPAALIRALLGGTAGGYLANKGAGALNLTPDQQALAGDIGTIAGGYGGAKAPELVKGASPKAVALAKLAGKEAISKIPVAGHLVQRPSLLDYIKAFQSKATPEAPAVAPSSTPAATAEQVNPALVSQSRTLPGMNPPEVIRPPAQPIPQRSGLMLPGDIDKLIPASKVSTTPPTKSAQIAQAKGIPAVKDMSTVLPRLQEIAKQIQAKEAAAPANADLTPALQKSLQPRIEGKIMQVLRKEGLNSTIGMEKLMDAPELKGISREQVQAAAKSLRDSGKVWGHEARGAGEEAPSIYGIALRKR